MIGPTGAVRVMVATRPVDFRKGAEGFAALVRDVMQADPFSGTVYVFRAKRADRVKLLYWDGTGVCLFAKKLEDGKFRWPRIHDPLRRQFRRSGFLSHLHSLTVTMSQKSSVPQPPKFVSLVLTPDTARRAPHLPRLQMPTAETKRLALHKKREPMLHKDNRSQYLATTGIGGARMSNL